MRSYVKQKKKRRSPAATKNLTELFQMKQLCSEALSNSWPGVKKPEEREFVTQALMSLSNSSDPAILIG